MGGLIGAGFRGSMLCSPLSINVSDGTKKVHFFFIDFSFVVFTRVSEGVGGENNLEGLRGAEGLPSL